MPLPEAAETLEEFGCDGDLATLAPFSCYDLDSESFAVDVVRLDVKGLGDSEPALIDEGEVSSVATITKGAK